MNNTKCPRCHGPATMIDKAPRGESGDVVRCDAEAECAALYEAARELERAHTTVVDAAHEFVTRVGYVKAAEHPGGVYAMPAEVKIPTHLYLDLQEYVREWKDAGEALVKATSAHAAATSKEHAA